VIEETMKNFQYSKGVYENMLLPQFNIFAEAVRKDISEEASYGMNDSDYSFGFEFTYRIGNNSAEGALKDVEIEIKSLALEYESALNEYTKSMLSLQESAAGTRDILTIQEEQIKAFNSQIATEKKKYLQARLNLSYLIETENNLSSGITSLINYKYELISSYIDYMDLTN
jgi:outer membrane protein TolC